MANIYRDSSEFIRESNNTNQNANFSQITAQYAVFENAAIDNLNVDQSAVFNTLSANGIEINGLSAGDILTTTSGGNINGLAIGPTNNVLTSSGGGPQWSNSVALNSVTTNALTIPGTNTGDLLVMDSNGTAQRLAVGVSGTFLLSDGTNPQWEPLPNPLIVGGIQINGATQLTSFPNRTLITDGSGFVVSEQPQVSINGSTSITTTQATLYSFSTWKMTQNAWYKVKTTISTTTNNAFSGQLQVFVPSAGATTTLAYIRNNGGNSNTICTEVLYNFTGTTSNIVGLSLSNFTTDSGTATISGFTLFVERVPTPDQHF